MVSEGILEIQYKEDTSYYSIFFSLFLVLHELSEEKKEFPS